MIELDGSFGEGGGQILRTSLALSLCTGRPFRVHAIRAGRPRPGLLRQHLTCVRAAAAIGQAEVQGAELGSTELVFRPGPVTGGQHRFAVGSAGSANLVLQSILPALLTASAPSEVTIEGGTHNPSSPSFEFIQQVFAPLLSRMGVELELELVRHGFYPAGGGCLVARVTPAARLAPLTLTERTGAPVLRATAVVSALSKSIARRELKALIGALELDWPQTRVVDVEAPRGPGNAVWVEVESTNITEMFVGFGTRGKSAEAVAARIAGQVQQYLSSGAPVGAHLADQLLIPLALASGGTFRTVPPTAHTTTNVAVVERFLPVRFQRTEHGDSTSFAVSPR
ncbi:MAG: RNA 3'-terminal phosphate cyclase (ATP) [Myxococcota bacterium]|jgi:RNA 3'-terminal phosphate cyclase (ATP)